MKVSNMSYGTATIDLDLPDFTQKFTLFNPLKTSR